MQHNAAMITTPTTKTVRVSVPVTPEVLEKFKRFSEASGLSLGKSIGDWLRDTVDGLDAMTHILETHKRVPAEAIAHFQGLASTLQIVAAEAIEGMKRVEPRREGVPLAGKAHAAALMREAAQNPRLVIRGGKSPKPGKGKTP